MGEEFPPVAAAYEAASSRSESERVDASFVEIRLETFRERRTYHVYLWIIITLNNGQKVSALISGNDVILIAKKILYRINQIEKAGYILGDKYEM
jgi:hypothetical protein